MWIGAHCTYFCAPKPAIAFHPQTKLDHSNIKVALRQERDLYAYVRPTRYFSGVPSPVRNPEYVDVIIFRENAEDIYTGIEFERGTEDTQRFQKLFSEAFPQCFSKIRFPESSGIGIKPVSEEGTEHIGRAAIQYAIAERKPSVTLVHKDNIMKYTEGAIREWGYQVAAEHFGAGPLDGGPGMYVTRTDTR